MTTQQTGQKGIVLFFTLLALLGISLAAVALIRSIDTGSLIAGNLTFKRSATNSGDTGIEAAIAWLTTTEAANTTLNVLMNTNHPFNNDGGKGAYLNAGYYSSLDTSKSLTTGNGFQWTDADSQSVGIDNSGNSIRYIIQRMCRTANAPIQSANCLFSSPPDSKNGMNILLPQEVCQGTGCPTAGQAPQLRITAKISGPRNTISYVQAFVY